MLCRLFTSPTVFSTIGDLVEPLLSLLLQNKRNITELKQIQLSQSMIIPQQIPAVFGCCKTYPGHETKKNLRGWDKMSFKVSSSHENVARKRPALVNLNCDL